MLYIFLHLFVYYSASFCTVHCALDLARDHVLQKCPLLIRASHSSPFRVLFSEEKGFTKDGHKVGVVSQDGLSSGWSGMRVFFHLAGLHLVFQIVRWGCLSSGWSFTGSSIVTCCVQNDWFFSNWTQDHYVPMDSGEHTQPSITDTRVPRDDDGKVHSFCWPSFLTAGHYHFGQVRRRTPQLLAFLSFSISLRYCISLAQNSHMLSW